MEAEICSILFLIFFVKERASKGSAQMKKEEKKEGQIHYLLWKIEERRPIYFRLNSLQYRKLLKIKRKKRRPKERW